MVRQVRRDRKVKIQWKNEYDCWYVDIPDNKDILVIIIMMFVLVFVVTYKHSHRWQ